MSKKGKAVQIDRCHTGKELAGALSIRPFQLIALVEAGLAPHDKYGTPMHVVAEDQWRLRQLMLRRIELNNDSDQVIPSRPKIGGVIQLTDNRSPEEKLKDLTDAIESLEASGVELPDLNEYEWSKALVLFRSEETISKLLSALFSEKQMLTLAGDLLDGDRDTFLGELVEALKIVRGDNPTSEVDANVPGYLTPGHEFHALELAIANKCANELFGKNGSYKNKTIPVRKQIMGWLEGHYSGLSDAAKGRITTLITPVKLKKGGAPKNN
jgi:hypothetical protein